MWSVFSEFAKRRASSLPDRKSTRLNSSHSQISYAVFCLKKIRRFPGKDEVIGGVLGPAAHGFFCGRAIEHTVQFGAVVMRGVALQVQPRRHVLRKKWPAP